MGCNASKQQASATAGGGTGPLHRQHQMQMLESTKTLLSMKASPQRPDRVYKLLLRAQIVSRPSSTAASMDGEDDEQHVLVSKIEASTKERQALYLAALDHLSKESNFAPKFRESRTKATPLHLVGQLVDIDQNMPSAKELCQVLDKLVQLHPEALLTEDCAGNIPVHYAIAPVTSSIGASSSSSTPILPQDWRARGFFVQHFIQKQTRQNKIQLLSSQLFDKYWQRNDVTYRSDEGTKTTGCSPLYRILETLDDDFDLSGPTVDYIRVVLQAMSVSAFFDGTSSDDMAGVGNAGDGDKPLSLLYRRFTRQFDISEMFFVGDNSRPEVVQHRQKYKCAAGNTWKVIESCLLIGTGGSKGHDVDVVHGGIVHRAVQMETPPDLLRYIVETNAQDLTQVDAAGNLPLHYAAMVKPAHINNAITTSNTSSNESGHFPAFYTKYVVDELLYKFPEAAGMVNGNGFYPLALAISSGKQWIGGGIKSLYDAYPQAIQQINLDEHEDLQRVFSLIQTPTNGGDGNNNDGENPGEERKETGPTSDEGLDDHDRSDPASALKGKGVIKDEHHDAIMLVQQPNVDIAEVTTSMWAHEEDAGVQMLGCIAIGRLLEQAKKDPQHILRIALTATASVVNAMKAHPNEMIVQEKACLALGLLAPADGRREVSMVASGAVAAVVAAMQAHVGDANIQQEACTAISSIVKHGGGDRATVVASVSGVTAILNAIAAHSQTESVQKEGFQALLSLTDFSQTGEASLPELPRTQTEPLLLQAKEDFPESCGPLVDKLMERMRND
mmetsp:Transcript_8641/g.21651  ORF Transcript_8641/g.21651 Transcript_8641/m.21651 type:complete len:786 (-) Transcript_8641:1564-3921(-)